MKRVLFNQDLSNHITFRPYLSDWTAFLQRKEEKSKFRNLFHASILDGMTRGPETMCPRTDFLGPLVPKMKRPGNPICRLKQK